MQPWTTPTFVFIAANAEVGAYQDDTERDREPPILTDTKTPAEPHVPAEEARR